MFAVNLLLILGVVAVVLSGVAFFVALFCFVFRCFACVVVCCRLAGCCWWVVS